MRNPPTLSKQAVQELAQLVGLELTSIQLDKMLGNVRALGSNLERLGKVDLTDVEPALIFRPFGDF